MVNTKKVSAVLPRIVETGSSDLGKLARSVEARHSQRVGRRSEDLPVHLSRRSIGSRDTIEEQSFVVTVPGIRFVRKGVGCVWGSFVVAMDLGLVRRRLKQEMAPYYLDVFESVILRNPRILLGSDVRHVAPVVSIVGR